VAENQIAKVSHKHHAIMTYMLSNPTATGAEIAKEFDVSQAWLSTIIHSDCFQQLMQEKQGEVFLDIMTPVSAKLERLAHLALDKMMEEIPNTQGTDAAQSVAELALSKIGYSAVERKKVDMRHRIDRDTLQNARSRIGAKDKAIDGEFVSVPAS